MSFRPPRPPKRKEIVASSSGTLSSSSSPLPPPSSSASPATSQASSRSASPSKPPAIHHHLVPPSKVPKGCRPRHSKSFYLPGPEHVLTLPGQDYSQIPSTSSGRPRVTQIPRLEFGAKERPRDAIDDLHMSSDTFDIINDVFITDVPESEQVQREKQKQKKQKQWKKWTEDIIPSLLRPHLRLLRKTASLRSMPRHKAHQCNCDGMSSRRLKVVCVSFEREFNVYSS